MSETNRAAEVVVYQMRVVLHGISPLIWRRLLVRGDSTVADLHRTLQVAFGWSDEHLHRFVIHGREHGGESLINPCRVRLATLGLRLKERFLYEYNFIDGWQRDVRVEQILPFEAGRAYPRSIGGRRRVPPEDCGGPWAFLELRERYSLVTIAEQHLRRADGMRVRVQLIVEADDDQPPAVRGAFTVAQPSMRRIAFHGLSRSPLQGLVLRSPLAREAQGSWSAVPRQPKVDGPSRRNRTTGVGTRGRPRLAARA